MKFEIPAEIAANCGAEQQIGDGLKGRPLIKNLPLDTFRQLKEDNMIEKVGDKWFVISEDANAAEDGAEEAGVGEAATVGAEAPAGEDGDGDGEVPSEAVDDAILNDPFLMGAGGQ